MFFKEIEFAERSVGSQVFCAKERACVGSRPFKQRCRQGPSPDTRVMLQKARWLLSVERWSVWG